MPYLPDKESPKLRRELEIMKRKAADMNKQIAFYRKFDFELQIKKMIELQRALRKIENEGRIIASL